MKTTTFILSYIITFIIIVTLCVTGGKWIYKDTSGRYGNYYTFECSKCGEFVTLCGVDGN